MAKHNPLSSRNPKPGSPEFGERAYDRREAILRRMRYGDLRIKTARLRGKERRDYINKLLKGD